MENESLIIKLRNCFIAGYTFPQFCIDNEIKKSLFVVENFSDCEILWEIFTQFTFEKRFNFETDFAAFEGNETEKIKKSPRTIFGEMTVKKITDCNPQDYDKFFFLTTKRLNVNDKKIIYLDELVKKFIFAAYMEIPFLTFLQRHPKVKLFLTNFTIISINPYNTENERKIIEERIPLATIAEKLRNDKDGTVKTPYDFLGYNKKDLIDLLTLTGTKTNPDGSTVLIDNDNLLVNVKNGRRVVSDQPENFKNRIYFLGGCSHLGVGAPFDKTIPSYLQKMLNKKHFPYRVENVSQFFSFRYQDIFYNLQNLPLADGDIIFVFFDNYLSEKLPAFDVSQTFERPHDYGEVFVDTVHVNELGYKALAEKFFDFLTENKFFQDKNFDYPLPPPAPHRYGIPQENFSSSQNFLHNKELEEYKKKLRADFNSFRDLSPRCPTCNKD